MYPKGGLKKESRVWWKLEMEEGRRKARRQRRFEEASWIWIVVRAIVDVYIHTF